MKSIIYMPQPRSKRIKFYIPYDWYSQRHLIKRKNGTFYHADQKLWSMPNTSENLQYLKHILQPYEELAFFVTKKKKCPIQPLTTSGHESLDALEQKLRLQGYSEHTIRAYRAVFIPFLNHFSSHDISTLRKEEIELYLYELKDKYHISSSKQNTVINAIKYFMEHVLGKPRTIYDVPRPKKAQRLPSVLSEQEVLRLLKATKNIKHKTILTVIYSAGLRISEAVKLRVEDIHSDQGYLFVWGGKGKKDRHTVLSDATLQLLRAYYKKYRPSYWLFEGPDGGQYSTSSITKVFRRSAKRANINAWATVHTLRHSFATHLLRQGVNLRYIQNMLGHQSSKTTEIYTHVAAINNKKVTSPLDNILKNSSFEADITDISVTP